MAIRAKGCLSEGAMMPRAGFAKGQRCRLGDLWKRVNSLKPLLVHGNQSQRLPFQRLHDAKGWLCKGAKVPVGGPLEEGQLNC